VYRTKKKRKTLNLVSKNDLEFAEALLCCDGGVAGGDYQNSTRGSHSLSLH